MKKLSIILSLIILISCSSKENSALDNNLLPQGLYKIIELKSDISMDLDLNGNPTKDFLVELQLQFNTQANYNLRVINNDNLNYRAIDLVMPKASIFPEYNRFDVVYEQRISTYEYSYDPAINKVSIKADESELLLYGSALIEKVELLPNTNLKLFIKHKYYYHPTGWQNVNLVAIYEKK